MNSHLQASHLLTITDQNELVNVAVENRGANAKSAFKKFSVPFYSVCL
jgi:hypothetical protein